MHAGGTQKRMQHAEPGHLARHATHHMPCVAHHWQHFNTRQVHCWGSTAPHITTAKSQLSPLTLTGTTPGPNTCLHRVSTAMTSMPSHSPAHACNTTHAHRWHASERMCNAKPTYASAFTSTGCTMRHEAAAQPSGATAAAVACAQLGCQLQSVTLHRALRRPLQCLPRRRW